MSANLCRSAIQSNRGATAVEFAIVIVPMLILMFGTVQNLLTSYARISLDNALQSLAYDLANSDSGALASLFTRQALCSRPAFYFVDCNASANFCFSINPIDPASNGPIPSQGCATSPIVLSKSTCCYQIIVEYSVPLAFDPLGQISMLTGSTPPIKTIRAVALAYRS